MRVVRYHEHGGPGELSVEEVDRPTPGRGEALVAVRAAGVNPVDTYFREGSFEPDTLPMTTGSDFAGVVDAVGEDVDVAVGDRVFGTALGNDRQGTYAEYVLAPADKVAGLPEGVSFAEGAAVALVGVAAWRALVDHADLAPGETCLVHGANGGVGHVAVQIADAAGARVVATAAEEYHADVADLGADATLEYEREDLAEAVLDVGRPDVVLDHRLDDYLPLDAEVGAQGVQVVGIGNTDPEAGFENVPMARAKELGLRLTSVFNTPDVAGVLRNLARLLDAGDLRPRIAREYELTEADAAQRAVLDDSFLGKLVVRP